MADAGFSGFKVRDDAQQSIQDANSAFWEENPESNGPTEEQTEEAKKLEIDTAVADARCAAKTSYEETLLQAQFDVEQKFVDKNKDILDALVAKYGVDS
ncbi:hypothetical protein GCM10022198_25010 [Klugiella xanthotipulae]|uniref:hypothetical protein n=1 Tax=Klugiella xanthotipulae TaxID=244735 RepID=UPI001154EB4E|nr:hypothetical protein [Klugiella xanthotipulae]